MTTADQSLVKTYSDRVYTHTTVVRHQGTVIAFAVDDQRRIVYTVLDLSTFDEKKGELDVAYWSENPAAVPFPAEVVKVGYAVAGATGMPVVKAGGRAEAGANEVLEPEEIDAFLSSTARLTAPGAPFQVLSDGSHVVVLRQAVARDHTDAVFTLADGAGSTGNSARADVVTSGTSAVPVVDGTLLCDRFLLVGGQLKPVSEVRFKRSRHKTRPASEKDSLGPADMDGKPFFEPTQELDLIRNLTGGRFAAVLVPTAVQGRQRWQFFAHNGATGRIDAFNVEQDPDGLFNTQGSRAWTSPNPQYRGSVYERQPGVCPFTGQALVPVVPDARHAETALRFNGTNNYLNMGDAPGLKFRGGAYTVEAWVKPKAAGGPVLARGSGAGGGFQLRITGTGQVALDHSGGTVTSDRAITADTWAHIAASFDGTTATLYIDGAFSGTKALASSGDGTALLHIGAKPGGPFYSGDIDEVRIWNRARHQKEIAEELAYRLIGSEPGLVAYYRFDEATGTRAYDQTDTAAHANLDTPPQWVTSLAPVGEHPGVRRQSFTIEGRDVVSGLAAALYYQQEDAVSGYRAEAQPVKRQARVLLACATRPAGDPAAEAHIASVDFGVGIDGRLADVPDVVTLAELGRPQEQSTDRVSAQQALVGRLEQDIASIQRSIAELTAEKATLDLAITQEQAPTDDPFRRALRIQVPFPLRDLVSDPVLSVGSALSVKLQSDASEQWWMMPLPGVPGRNGNPAVALVWLGPQTRVLTLDTASNRALLVPQSLADPIPQDARWYISGMPTIAFTLQCAGNDRWLMLLAGLFGTGVITWDDCTAFVGSMQGMVTSPQLATRVARRDAIPGLIAQSNADLAAKRTELQLAQEELNRLTAGLLGAADLVLPLPHIGIDATGLSSAGALLKFARTDATPFLMDGAAGRMTLYFRGANGQFFAAYLDTGTQRGSQQLTGGGQTVLLTARDPGVDLGPGTTTITVSDHTLNGTVIAERCDLTITRGTERETFPGLPRAARGLVAAVSGLPGESVPVGTVASVQGSSVTLAAGAPLALPAAGYLRIGGTCHRVSTAVERGATTVTVTPAPAAAVGAVVSLVDYDTSLATASRPGASLDGGSRWVTVGAARDDLPVPNGTATARTPGHGSRWRGDSPGRAFTFDGTAQRLSLPAARLDQVTTPAGDLSVEAWIKPARPASSPARILHTNRGTTKAALGLVTAPSLPGAATFDPGTDQTILIDPWNPLAGDFTIECWLKRAPTSQPGNPALAIESNALVMGFTSEGKFEFQLRNDTGAPSDVVTTTDVCPVGEWHHWAVTFDRATRLQTVVRDGVEVARQTAANLPRQRVNLVVGRDANPAYWYYSGSMAELRGWSVARTPADINADKGRRITGSEPGLVGSWVWDATRAGNVKLVDLSGRNLHGRTLAGPPAAGDSPLSGYRIAAAIADKARQSREVYSFGEWAHLAAVYEESWALRFDGTAWAETPDADALDLTEDLTIEVFARIDAIGARQGLVSKGKLGDGTGGSVPYQFSLLGDGRLEFAFEEPDSTIRRYTSATPVTAGFHRLAVVRKGGKSTEEIKGTKTFTYKDQDGKETSQTADVVDRVDTKTWDDITFVVDGAELAIGRPNPLLTGLVITESGRYTGPGPRGNDGPLEIGRAREGTNVHPFQGAIGEVRIWARARDTAQLGTPVQPRDENLIARWTFEENTGNTTADRVGGYDLKIRRARWTTDPDPRAATFTLYRNGQPAPTDTPATNPLGDWGGDQLTLGARNINGTHDQFYRGALEDVRLWRAARTAEQILDSLFTRLKGDKQDLLGYWPFDSDSTTAGVAPETAALQDQSLRGNHLAPGTTNPALTLSTAPISTDTAAVRSALSGIRTAFHERVSTPPAAAEYADLQYTADGQAAGVLKRAYVHITDGTWHLTTGYKVGDLITEWVSQVQYDPQLIGYIEGAPPVPSENLTGKSDPAGASSVTFKEADKVTSVLGSAGTKRVDMVFKASAQVSAKFGAQSVTAPLGLGVSNPIVTVDVKGTVSNTTDFSNTWTNETVVSQATTIDRNTTANLTGFWEDPTSIRNTTVGKRYLPDNKGYALVQSETADVYALRLAHSGDLVAYRMLPNPDIPKDWNIISFPINSQYTKQGTLDGAIGLTDQGAKILDTAYPTATGYGEYSYFKPREAYALKRRILRERQELENFYASVSTDTDDTDPTAAQAAKILHGMTGITPAKPEAKPDTESAGAFASRNIANTYVWTADGGFFSETTGTIDVVTETVSGSYTVNNKTVASLDVNLVISGVGNGFTFDATLGGGYSRTRRRSQEASRGHSLDVICKPNRDLQKYQADGTPAYVNGKPVLVPGKVDAYRFMTFYLAQDTTHFDDFYNKVIDPTWLANSNDANANALRQARQSDTKPPCWRILHRVTFLSRILPPIPTNAPASLARDMRTIDIPSNYELIRRLDPYVSSAATTLPTLTDAVRTALTTHLPALTPHTQEIAQFLAAYYGISE
ncbi:LamG-like jellyroll fold domain-containing protein [Streptomyces sp. NPDC057638]|uniref:LamG domain-containing protein n=1 Tax=Streptomyces sp. NPDC057638 TaxID=3346190 RepID=UPI0036A7A01F